MGFWIPSHCNFFPLNSDPLLLLLTLAKASRVSWSTNRILPFSWIHLFLSLPSVIYTIKFSHLCTVQRPLVASTPLLPTYLYLSFRFNFFSDRIAYLFILTSRLWQFFLTWHSEMIFLISVSPSSIHLIHALSSYDLCYSSHFHYV